MTAVAVRVGGEPAGDLLAARKGKVIVSLVRPGPRCSDQEWRPASMTVPADRMS